MGAAKIDVLDHGYVELIETWGTDERIIEAARMSTGKGFLGWGPHFKCRSCGCLWRNNHDGTVSLFDVAQRSCVTCESNTSLETCDETSGDEKLLRFLWENKHATPFEMAGATFEIKAPIMVFREWHRHRTQSYNEMSARYVPLPDENYTPTLERMLMVNGQTSNKQASGVSGAVLSEGDALEWLAELADVYEHAQRVYERGIALGVAKELARLPVHVARYSRMRASANLRNWLAFFTLRSTPKNPAAQWEIRGFADAAHDLLVPSFGRTLALFDEKRT